MRPRSPPEDNGYKATHQLLYLFISDFKQIACSHKLNKHLEQENTNIEERVVHLCTRIYSEAQMNFQSGIFDRLDGERIGTMKDLFAESIVVCSLVNFEEFLRTDWIEKLLQWTDNEYGCLIDTQSENESLSGESRHLLSSQTMTGNCVSHASSLIGAAVTKYLYHVHIKQ
ncbi:UPF0764 protein C16orf89 homolog [Tubulanus polymorphus]|uniref:UPF0764 protein C16orf89 homolog n=1 Tax=Tubulanus polymorphus TaxID=672921 RepID=UPI003DA3B910